MPACDACVRRTWLVGRVSGYLDYERGHVDELLRLDDESLIGLWRRGSRRGVAEHDLEGAYAGFGRAQADAVRARAAADRLEMICRCDGDYPPRLYRLTAPPAVLHVAGGMSRFLRLALEDPVAIVGTRRPTIYGTDVAQLLGRGVSASGLSVVSGMAMGIDGAAHRGAVAGGGRAIAVLPGSAAEPYPRVNRQLYAEILRGGVAVSELGVGAAVRRWTLLARNRIIAALAELTIVVQGRAGSGALKTAALASDLGAAVGAVPGSVLVAQSDGPHMLLQQGAVLVRNPQDVLDAVCGAGTRPASSGATAALRPEQREVLEAVGRGDDTIAALGRTGMPTGQLLAALAALELAGCLRRGVGGRYVVVADRVS